MAAWNPDVLSPDEREQLRSLEYQIESALSGLSTEERQAVLKAALETADERKESDA